MAICDPARAVTLLKTGNRFVVNPTTPAIRTLLEPQLSFRAIRFLYGVERIEAGGRSKEIQHFACYGYDLKERLATSWGFHDRVTRLLTNLGYTVRVQDLQPHPAPEIFEPQWDRLFRLGIELRHKQDDLLIKLLSHPCGRFDCPTGYGKSFLIGCLATILPKARIHVVTKRVPVLRDRIYPELCQMLGGVGICGGGMRRLGHRVQLFSADSLHRSDGKADILIADECHELAADKAAGMLARYDESRNYGLSATQDMRLDKKDLRNEAIFGPLLLSIKYQEAQAHGMVVPIHVIWSNVVSDYDPVADTANPVERKRRGIWRNEFRNEIIAANSQSYGPEVQELITVETLEHALYLKQLLPGHTLVYSDTGCTHEDRAYFRRMGVWPENEPLMTRERKAALTKAFEAGTLKKVICTTVWNVGVNFRALAVLNRADGGGSPINDTQIPGRTSRPHLPSNKQYATIHDYKDQFNKGFRRRAANRRSNYAAHGWTQAEPDEVDTPDGASFQPGLFDDSAGDFE